MVWLVCVALLAAPSASAAPSADLWPRWLAHSETSGLTVNHDVWDTLLARFVRNNADGINRVGYSTFSKADRAELAGYLDTLAAVATSELPRAEQRAYWINLYNALTLSVVLDHWPVASIRDIDISPGLFADGPWGAKLVTVEGVPLSLDDIEHRILRPIWEDPLVHYAVNCASLGCPNLQAEAFTPANTERLLQRGAFAFVNHQRGARVRDGQLYVSSLYDWFKDDFGGNDAGVIAHLRRYASPALARALASVNQIAGDAYNWSINVADPAADEYAVLPR